MNVGYGHRVTSVPSSVWLKDSVKRTVVLHRLDVSTVPANKIPGGSVQLIY